MVGVDQEKLLQSWVTVHNSAAEAEATAGFRFRPYEWFGVARDGCYVAAWFLLGALLLNMVCCLIGWWRK